MDSTRSRVLVRSWFVLVLAVPAWAQVTQRMSVDSSGLQGNLDSISAAITPDGRYVVFSSAADTLVPGDTNLRTDIFLRDRVSGTTERVSVSATGIQGNGHSTNPVITPDGRYVAFASESTNFTPAGTSMGSDIFVRDRVAGTTEMVSVGPNGVPGEDASDTPAITPDGRFVVFASRSTNLYLFDTNTGFDIFIRDRLLNSTDCLSVDAGGIPGNQHSTLPAISADGRYVVFKSESSNLVPGDTNDREDIFVRDRERFVTERISVGPGGVQADQRSGGPAITPDGRFVAFWSDATNLAPGDANNHTDIFVLDRELETLDLASLTSIGTQPNDGSFDPAITPDGRFVTFQSIAMGLVPGDNNGSVDIFLRDRALGTTERVSVASGGAQANGGCFSSSMSADGRFVAYHSVAPDLVPGDTNGHYDVFVGDRAAAGFSSVCDAGANGTLACPCANPPGQPGSGCNNSFATGGAVLSASGVAYLSQDSLRFATSGEGPTSMSILLQGNGALPSGAVVGQGVRCVGGSIIRRLFVKQASGGSIQVPESALGEPGVSTQSASRGDLIHPGESRWYLVYYRDPVVLGGCAPTSTFNATQTGRIDWSL